MWAFLEDFSSSDMSDASSKAAGFAQQLGRFLTYFHLTALHKNFVVIGAANEVLQSSLTLHFQQAAIIVATLLDCLQSDVHWILVGMSSESQWIIGIEESTVLRIRRSPWWLDEAQPMFFHRQRITTSSSITVLPVELDWYCLMCNSTYSSKVWIWHMTFSLNSIEVHSTGVLISDSYKDDINAERLHSTQQYFTTSLNRNSRQ